MRRRHGLGTPLQDTNSSWWPVESGTTYISRFATRANLVGRVRVQLHVEEGQLICPESGRRFPISKGIPNMLLNEDEC